MKISLLILAILLLNQNSVKAFSQTSTNTNEIESDNTYEVFAEREDFWTRELGKSIGKFLPVYMHIMAPHN